MRLHPVILAGGAGTRLWPLSRRRRPKPLHSPLGGASLLEQAWGRARSLAPAGDSFVAAHEDLADAVQALLPELPAENLLVEAERRDTGPAAVHAAWALERRAPGALMALLPADHRMEAEPFRAAMVRAAAVAGERDALVCLGVPPDRPATDYGYLRTAGAPPGPGAACPVAQFVEKPDRARARALMEEGQVLWNAGIFVWSADRFLREVEAVCPELARPLAGLKTHGDPRRFFEESPAVAVDRAVLERSRRAWVVGTAMGWDDLGGWNAVARHLPADASGNAAAGRVVPLEARRCVVHSPDKPVVLLGVEDLVVVECGDVLLVAARDRIDDLRDLAERLARHGLE